MRPPGDRVDLTGLVAIVAGGGGGLGRASALALASAGATVAVCDRDRSLLAGCAEAIEQGSGAVITGELDVTDRAALTRFFDQVVEEVGGLDVLVNAVGLPLPECFAESDGVQWAECVEANYLWAMHSMRLACDRFSPAGGSVINFTTIEAHRSAPGNAVYAGAKAALMHASRTLAVELAPRGVRVNCIAPDMTPTERPRTISFLGRPGTYEAAVGAQYAVPIGRLGTYDDVAGCVLFLASDLSAYVTGQTIHLDGGTFASSGWTYWPGPPGYGSSGFLPIPPQHVMDFLVQQ